MSNNNQCVGDYCITNRINHLGEDVPLRGCYSVLAGTSDLALKQTVSFKDVKSGCKTIQYGDLEDAVCICDTNMCNLDEGDLMVSQKLKMIRCEDSKKFVSASGKTLGHPLLDRRCGGTVCRSWKKLVTDGKFEATSGCETSDSEAQFHISSTVNSPPSEFNGCYHLDTGETACACSTDDFCTSGLESKDLDFSNRPLLKCHISFGVSLSRKNGGNFCFGHGCYVREVLESGITIEAHQGCFNATGKDKIQTHCDVLELNGQSKSECVCLSELCNKSFLTALNSMRKTTKDGVLAGKRENVNATKDSVSAGKRKKALGTALYMVLYIFTLCVVY